jgi:GTP pyrophosphokinase
LQNTLAAGRTFIHRELAREGATAEPLEPLAARLGFVDSQAMYLAAGRGEIGPRAVAVALRGETDSPLAASLKPLPKAVAHQDGVLVEGVGKLLTHLARCCKPVPPDPIQGFITRGRGVSIHRMACLSYQHMARAHPERRIKTEWGPAPLGRSPRYSVNIRVESVDRQGLLRDISDVLSREKINVTAVRTQSIKGRALMSFTLEVEGLAQLQHALKLISEVPSVGLAKRE